MAHESSPTSVGPVAEGKKVKEVSRENGWNELGGGKRSRARVK